MFTLFSQKQARPSSVYRKAVAVITGLTLILETFLPLTAQAQQPFLPEPGVLVSTSPEHLPARLKGIIIDPTTPFNFDFIMDMGHEDLQGEALSLESSKLLRYFLAALTMPEEDLWVNLSPHEADRVIPATLAVTELGHDLLAQDYLLKQVSASLTHPEQKLGETYWRRLREIAHQRYGTEDVPLQAFNKVWIVPERAQIYENGDRAYIVNSHLKVMTERDYQATKAIRGNAVAEAGDEDDIATTVMREVIIPEIEREVNQGAHFAPLRQIYHSFILAVWYKDKLKRSFLGQKYFDQKKIEGIDLSDSAAQQDLYDRYLSAFRKGVYNYIKEDYDLHSQTVMPRQYFSGGVVISREDPYELVEQGTSPAWLVESGPLVRIRGRYAAPADLRRIPSDFAMLARAEKTARVLHLLDPEYSPRFSGQSFNPIIERKIKNVDAKSALAEVIAVSDQHSDPDVLEEVLTRTQQNMEAGVATEVSLAGDIIDHIIGKKRFGKMNSIRKKMNRFNDDPKNWKRLLRVYQILVELQQMADDPRNAGLLRVSFIMGNNEVNFIKSVANGYIQVPEAQSDKVDVREIARFILEHFRYTFVDSWGFKHMHVISPMHRRNEERVLRLQREALEEFDALSAVDASEEASNRRLETWYAAADSFVYGQALGHVDPVELYTDSKLTRRRQANNVFWNNLFIKFFNGYTIRNPNNQLWLTPYEVDSFLDEHQAIGVIAGHQHVPSFSDVDHRLFNVAVYGKKQKGFLVLSPDAGIYFKSTGKKKPRPILSRQKLIGKLEQDFATEMIRDTMKASGSGSIPIALSEAQATEIRTKETRLADVRKSIQSRLDTEEEFRPDDIRLQQLIREERILMARLLKIRISTAVDRRIRAPQISRQILLDDPNTFLFPNTFTNVPASMLDGSFVVARVDYNSTVKNRQISMNTRIVATVPMLVQAIKAGAKIGLYSHLEDPAIEVESRIQLLQQKYQKNFRKIKRRRKKYRRQQEEAGEELDPVIMNGFIGELADAQHQYRTDFVDNIDALRARIREEVNADLSLAPVAEELERLINAELESQNLDPITVHFDPKVLTAWDGQRIIKEMRPGDIVLFENTRVAPEEMLLHKTKSALQKKFDAVLGQIKGAASEASPLPSGAAEIVARLESIRDEVLYNYQLVEADVLRARSNLAGIITDAYYSRLLGIEFTQPTNNHALTIRQLIDFYISPVSRERLSTFFGLIMELDQSLSEVVEPLRAHLEHQKKLFFGARFYVNDSAATLHRAHASLLPPPHLGSFVGPLVVQEVALLETLKANLEFAVLGGKNAKSLDEKMIMLLPALSNLPTMKKIAVFGQPAIAFLKALEELEPGSAPGVDRIPLKVPAGKTAEKYVSFAKKLLQDPRIREQLILPEYLLMARSSATPGKMTQDDLKVVHVGEDVRKGVGVSGFGSGIRNGRL